MLINDAWIEKYKPCQEAVEWWDEKKRTPDDSIKILELLIKAKKLSWANWYIMRIMSYEQSVSYAVYAAEQVIDNFEKKHPDDKRPRQAIEAAKLCIKNPSKENKAAAYAAADAAADAAAADAVAYAAAYAADAAAADAAAYAAYAYADAAAAYAAYAYADAAALKLKILKYGVSLLKKQR